MNTIQATMDTSKISEPRDLKQKWRLQIDLVWFRGVLPASLRICSIDAMETQQFTTVGEVENEDIRL